jgi:Tfp pilus assembly protein PilF
MQFGGFRVDEVHRTVTTPARRVVRLEPKAFDLLIYFAAHPGETLSKDRLIADVWGGKFVTDDAVMVAVYALRQAFGDDSRAPKFIETIRGRGYRWIASEALPVAGDRLPVTGHRQLATRLWRGLIAIAAFAVLVMAVLRPAQPMPSMKLTSELVRTHARGLFFSERTTRADLEKARVEFRKAIRIDERFAEPHAALAETCVRLIEVGSMDPENESEARRELKRALELEPRLAYSQAALASVQFVLDRDVPNAERSFRYAIELDPSLPDTHRRYSYLLDATGRFAEATQQAQMAVEMEPASVHALLDLAWTYMLAGRLAEAESTYRDALRLEPSNMNVMVGLGYCLQLRNAPAEAMQWYRRALQLRGAPPELLARYDRAFATAGLPAVYAAYVDQMKPNRKVARWAVAIFAALAGRSSESLALLRESMRLHEPGTMWLGVHPAFASLRHQREFAALVASSFHTR